MIELDVRGMDCEHCVRAVTEAVRGLDPGAAVRVDLAGGRVSADTTATGAAVQAAIAAAGYEAAVTAE